MYRIDPQKARIINDDATITQNGLEPTNKFDLVNTSDYDARGNLVRKAENPKDYDIDFAIRLSKIRPVYNCAKFLDYHYDQTPDKNLFLNHIEFHVLGCWKFTDNCIKCVKGWIESKNLQQNKASSNLPVNVGKNPGKKQGEFSDIDCAVALHELGIALTTNGIGTNDGTNYAELFGFGGRSLYNKLNAVVKGRVGGPKHQSAAKRVIKKYNLKKVVTS